MKTIFRSTQWLLFSSLIISFFTSCSDNTKNLEYGQVFSLIESGLFAQADSMLDNWALQHPDDSIIVYFGKSLNGLFSENDSILEANRGMTFKTEETTKQFTIWMKMVDGDTTNTSMLRDFVRSINAAINRDTAKALLFCEQAINKAKDNSKAMQLLEFHKIALTDSLSFISGGIPTSEALSWKGMTFLNKKNWIPASETDPFSKEKFTITGGSLYTYYGKGKFEQKATFGAWAYAIDAAQKDTAYWAALLTDGGLFVKSKGDSISPHSSTDLQIDFDCSYEIQPVDYYGTYKLIHLDKKQQHCYPVLMVPYFKEDNDIENEGLLFTAGDHFRIRPQHFQQGRDSGIQFFGDKNLVRIVEKEAVVGRVYWLEKF